VTYFDGDKLQTPPASAVTWSSNPAILAANNPPGNMTGVARGTALVTATVQSAQGSAIIAVSDPVDITLLLDTLYLLPGDTMTIPTIILHRDPTLPTVSYDPSPDPTVYTVDGSGLVMATSTPGGPTRYTVTATEGSLTATASGGVYVLAPNGVGAGKAFFTVVGPSVPGTALRHATASPVAVNYTRPGGNSGFRMRATSSSSDQVAQVTLPAGVSTDPAMYPSAPFEIDSITPADTSTCTPPRAWAIRSSTTSTAYSGNPDLGQQISFTQLVSDGGSGQVISGRFAYRARRSDFYTSPLSLLRITAVFVAPLTSNTTMCP